MKDLTNRPKMFRKKVFLTKILQYLQGDICVGVSFFINLQRPANLSKKTLRHRCFPLKIAIFLRIPFL